MGLAIAACLGAAVPAAGQDDAPVPQDELSFAVMEYVVRGNSVLTPADIQRSLSPFTGYDKGVPDVMAARKALESAYRDRGYQTVVVDVPQQDVSSGIIELQVTEGRIGRVRVSETEYVLPSEVRESIPGLKPGTVPNIPQLQTELARSNGRATRTVTPEFRAGAAPGTVDVDLVVDEKRPWGASLELNDQFNRSTERLRASASLHYDNLWQSGHSLNVAFQAAPEDLSQVQVYSGSYYAPIGYSRTSLLAYAVQSNTDVATIGGLTVLGDGFTAGGRLIRTLGGSPAGTVQSLMFGFDYKDYLDQIGLTDPETGDVLTFDTPVTYLPFTAQYRWLQVRDKTTAEFSIGTTFAFDGIVGKQSQFGGRPDNPLTPGYDGVAGKRDNAQASFLYLYGAGSYRRELGNSLDLSAGLNWQLATDPLISNEQFALGGLASVRGYRDAEVLGDSGVRGSVELGYTVPLGTDDIEWRIAAFADAGHAWIERPLPEENASSSLASIGLTTRFDALDHLFGQFDLAYQFDTNPTNADQKVTSDFGDVRLHFKIGAKY